MYVYYFSAFSADTVFIVCFLHLPAHVAIQTYTGFFQCKLLVMQTSLCSFILNAVYFSIPLITERNVFDILWTMTPTSFYFRVQSLSIWIVHVYLRR